MKGEPDHSFEARLAPDRAHRAGRLFSLALISTCLSPLATAAESSSATPSAVAWRALAEDLQQPAAVKKQFLTQIKSSTHLVSPEPPPLIRYNPPAPEPSGLYYPPRPRHFRCLFRRSPRP